MQVADRMKSYEKITANQYLTPNLPVCVRIDGKAFHSWTAGLKRPYDERIQELFDRTTSFLVEQTKPCIGYTQSDEISLIFYNYGNPESQIFFNGKICKLNSVLASMATAKFNSLVPELLPDKSNNLAFFDCRVWTVPDMNEAVNYLIWREQDATRNSIQSAAQSVYSHRQLHGKNTKQLNEMLFQKGINWNDYPVRFKRGAYFQRKTIDIPFTSEELNTLPEKHNALTTNNLTIKRSVVAKLDMPILSKITNRIEVVFNGNAPISKENEYANL